MSGSVGDDDDDDDQPLPRSSWTTVASAFTGAGTFYGRDARGAASKIGTGLSIGTAVASHSSTMVAAGVGGAAVLGAGTAGVGLAVAGAAFTLIGIGTSAVSLVKTMDHIEKLGAIYRNPGRYQACKCVGASSGEMANDHDYIDRTILPYIMRKKGAKAVKKGVGAVGLSLFTAVARVGKAAYKSVKGTKGKRREYYAYVLARHTITHECALAKAIVGELYSEAEYMTIRAMSSDAAGERIAAKMKSV